MAADMNNQTNSSYAPEPSVTVRDSERFKDISGYGPYNRPKAHVMLRYYEQYSDGTSTDLQVLTFDKPIISVFHHPGYVNICMDFSSVNDVDLRTTWDLLTAYSSPANNVSYLPEELESGFYTVNGIKKKVYFPLLELILSPIGKESEYEIHALNPAFFTLSTNSPLSFEPCVLQFTYDESWINVINELEYVDMNQLRDQVMHELAEERGFSLG